MSGCYACEFYEDFDGNVQGNKNCAKLQIAEDSFAGAMLCPKYAHASCYTASSYHIDYSDPDGEFSLQNYKTNMTSSQLESTATNLKITSAVARHLSSIMVIGGVSTVSKAVSMASSMKTAKVNTFNL